MLVLAGSAGQAPAAGVTVSGTVLDQSGAVLPAAPIELIDQSGTVVQYSTANDEGAFRFDAVRPGNYTLRTTVEGFKPRSLRVRVAARAVVDQKLVLDLADVTQEVTVSDRGAGINTGAANNVDAVSVD